MRLLLFWCFTGPFTIFAPSNIAFLRLAPEYQNAINKDPNVLADVLKYHVVPGIVTSGDLMVNEKMLDTLSGKKIRVNYYMYSKVSDICSNQPSLFRQLG